jgi:hypothetical protein
MKNEPKHETKKQIRNKKEGTKMKTITLDYETYTKELAEAREDGITSGLFKASAYINDPETYMLSRDDYYSQCKSLDKAIAYRISKESRENEEESD